MNHEKRSSALFELSIPSLALDVPTDITLKAGSSVIFVGANGSGKTRLSEYIETELKLRAHRISAHRAQSLNPSIFKISEENAVAGLRTGDTSARSLHDQLYRRKSNRWGMGGVVALLNDYDQLLQVLFADQANIALETYKEVRKPKHQGDDFKAKSTKFEVLKEIWKDLLPQRTLEITGDDIKVLVSTDNEPYSASELSDGERAIFYLIGQTLAVADDSLLIIDEPELHVHRSIMGKLWDSLEKARQDCAFVFITHDLEFAASRVAQKYVVNDYIHPLKWKMQRVPEDSGFDEEISTLILGSRKPILFVEGSDASLDKSIYRNCFPDWTVISRGSCEDVIHSVKTMERNKELAWVKCKGIVDVDDRDEEEIKKLEENGISVLRVSEIENVILLPSVSRVIAESDGCEGDELNRRLNDLQDAIFAAAEMNTEEAVKRHCCRRIDRLLKKIDLSGKKSVDEIESEYKQLTGEVNVQNIAQSKREQISNAVKKRDLELLLENYDDKGLLAIAARELKKMKKMDFCNWLSRNLGNKKQPQLTERVRDSLPVI